ncbi:MAG TPA: hypothetical protein VMT95_09490 [Candidatus Binatia bacterium]|nr:hypothetical protein [Candidatus Binatia bacterium]
MRASDSGVQAEIGYAVGPRGLGLAYARLTGSGRRKLLRSTFRASRGQTDRAGGYAAVTAVARALRDRGFDNLRFVLNDAELVDEIVKRREPSETLALPYVRLRCVLNTLAGFTVAAGATDDLTQRARAEVALNLAA